MKSTKTRLPLTQDSDRQRILQKAQERQKQDSAGAKKSEPSPDASAPSEAVPLPKVA
ncbi:MAG: hypothetical protein M3347_13160 [Armatimonadota bacterium]|nr:hypothetical protein [Armatimonadota bacterium]